MAGKLREQISSVELWSTMFIFIVATATIIPIGALAGHQSWIAVIIGTLIAAGYAFIYTGLCDKYPGKTMVEIGEAIAGGLGGKITGLLYAWHGFLIACLMMRDHWYFTQSVALPNTPPVVLTVTVLILVIWIAYAGLEVMCRVSILFVPVVIFYTFLAFLLLIKDINLRNLEPLFKNNWREIFYAALQTSIIPLGGGVVFTMIFSQYNKEGQAKKPSLLGVAAAGVLILTTRLMNILVLGTLAPKLSYPSYTAYSYVQAADFIDRGEITIFTLFISINFIKMSVVFYATALCLAQVFHMSNYRVLIVPLGLLVIETSMFLMRNQAEFASFITYTWPWASMVPVFLVPLLLFIISSIKKKRNRVS